MSNFAIQAENIGKSFSIGAVQTPYSTLRDTVTSAFTAPFKRASQLLRGQAYGASDLTETIWALKHISFQIRHGEVVGIIGHNGAGKSTLLKILSRITEPTEGYARIYGRVGSLLEVGTGFHQELTGRENIYLNAAILGMKQVEINRKFDEIVDFAGVEKFLDTPVKHYSTGMQLRLGFAVAAHLEPEILVVDEVLAVGDAEFQKKCLGKMSDVAQSGRTVLFVSHNTAAIQSLCTRTILLKNGTIQMDDETPIVLQHYQAYHATAVNISLKEREDRSGNGLLRFVNFRVSHPDEINQSNLISGEDALLHLYFQTHTDRILKNIDFVCTFEDIYGSHLFSCHTRYKKSGFSNLSKEGEIHCHIPRLPLTKGTYYISVWAYTGDVIIDHIDHAVQIEVLSGDYFGTGEAPTVSLEGYVLVDHEWKLVE